MCRSDLSHDECSRIVIYCCELRRNYVLMSSHLQPMGFNISGSGIPQLAGFMLENPSTNGWMITGGIPIT